MLGGGRRPRWGQHFLVCDEVVRDLVNLSEPSGEEVIEIGAGKGKLTEELLLNYKRVVAIEKDKNLIMYLRKRFEEEIKEGRLDIINKDFRALLPEEVNAKKLVASIPYYISQEVIEFIANSNIKLAVLLVQEEFAKKIVSEREKEYSYISYLIQYSYIPIYIKTIPPSCFSPPPKVNSAIVKMVRRKKDIMEVSPKEERIIKNVVKEMFNYKNKKATKAIRYAVPKELKINKIIEDERKVKDMDVYELTEFVYECLFSHNKKQ